MKTILSLFAAILFVACAATTPPGPQLPVIDHDSSGRPFYQATPPAAVTVLLRWAFAELGRDMKMPLTREEHEELATEFNKLAKHTKCPYVLYPLTDAVRSRFKHFDYTKCACTAFIVTFDRWFWRVEFNAATGEPGYGWAQWLDE